MAKRILVVEDNELNMKLMCDVLSVNGYDVTQAADGEFALNLLKNMDFDLILLDMQMPKKSGYEVLAEIEKDIPIIIVSAYARKEEIDKVKDFKHIDYLTKPLNIKQFLYKVSMVFS